VAGDGTAELPIREGGGGNSGLVKPNDIVPMSREAFTA
jgi:hypothetical protein